MNNITNLKHDELKAEDNTSTASLATHSQPKWKRYIYSLIAAEISRASRYYDKLIQIEPRPEDEGLLRELIDVANKDVIKSHKELPSRQDVATNENCDTRTVYLFNGNFNHDFDIQGTLQQLREKLTRSCRIAVVAYNPYLRSIYRLANTLGLRRGEVPETFVTETDLRNIASLSGYELTSIRPVVYFPWELAGLGNFLNRALPVIPLLKWLSLTSVIFIRPIIGSETNPSLSIVIPARNERGNIRPALERLDYLKGIDLEIIFVEGHSKDGTWEEIQKVCAEFKDRYKLQAHQQTGKGKSDAVRLGFAKASNQVLTILDADLTMPPELLYRFYDAYKAGKADFINGNRLTYPMEGEAMKFLNHLGNIFFAKALSTVLGIRIGDSLCGTKLLSRADYERFIAWRKDFGDFDPFGDFELLFPAAELSLGVIDIPIRYRDRTYGATNIRRFYHGLMLLKMTWIGFKNIMLGRQGKI